MAKKFLKLIIILVVLKIIVYTCFFYQNKVYAEAFNYIVAIVNQEIITQTEIRKALLNNPEIEKMDNPNLSEKMVWSVINEKLQLQEANRLGISVYPDEIDQGLEEIKSKNGLTDDLELEKALASQNLTIETLRDKMKKEILLLKIRDRIVRSKIHLTEAEIIDYFNQRKKKGGQSVHLSHILFSVPREADEKMVKSVFNQAEKVCEELSKGKDFSQAAREFSQDMQTSSQGGDLGYLELDQISIPFKKELEKIKPGQFSQPIRTDFGFHIIKLTDQRAITLVKDSVEWKEIKETLINKKMEEHYQQWLEELKKSAYIKIKNYPPFNN